MSTNSKAEKTFKTRIYFATSLEPIQSKTLTKMGVKNRLVSFYYLRPLYRIRRLRRVRRVRRLQGLPPDELTEYVRTGKVTKISKPNPEHYE